MKAAKELVQDYRKVKVINYNKMPVKLIVFTYYIYMHHGTVNPNINVWKLHQGHAIVKPWASTRADEWNVNKLAWEGTLKAISKGEECIKLEDKNTVWCMFMVILDLIGVVLLILSYTKEKDGIMFTHPPMVAELNDVLPANVSKLSVFAHV
uniref:Uncharacterized protein n=1 Tax=Oryza brachyantha TaxID=4533 RepID=J3LW35_ORYBR